MTTSTLTLSDLHQSVLSAVQRARPLELGYSEMNGRRGCTAVGACIIMGYSGSVADIYAALDELHAMGLVKRGHCIADTVYYV